MAAPEVGAIINGYKFVGGDYKNPASWAPAGVQEIAQAKSMGAVMGKKGPEVVDQNGFNDAVAQLKDIQGARKSAGWTNTGAIGALSTHLPGSPGFNLDKELGTIRARIMLSNMQRMKNQSVTGATGLGQMSNAEGDTLRSTIAPLDVGLPAGELRQSLDRVQEAVLRDQPGLQVDAPIDLSAGQARATIPKGAYYRDPLGNIRRNDNGDAGNPIMRGNIPRKAPAVPKAPPGVDPTAWSHMTPQERALWP